MCIYHILFICFSVHGHMGCFYVLAIVNDAAMNMGVQIVPPHPPFSFFFFRTDPEVELLDHTVILFLIFGGTTILFSTVAVPFYIPTNSSQGFHILVNTYHFLFF